MKHHILFILFLIAGTLTSTAQNAELDSLINAEKVYTQQDSRRMALLTDLMLKLRQPAPRQCMEYCKKTIALANALGDKSSEALAYSNKGICFHFMGKPDSAIAQLNYSLSIYRSIADSAGIAKALNNLCNIFVMNRRDVGAAELYGLECIAIREKAGDKKALIGSYQNLGIVYTLKADYRKAQALLLKAVQYAKETGQANRISNVYMQLGTVYNYLLEDEKAREYYMKALTCASPGDELGIAQINMNIGVTYMNVLPRDEAFRYFNPALKIFRKYDNNMGIVTALTDMGHMLNNMSDTSFRRMKQAGLFDELNPEASDQFKLASECLQEALKYDKKVSKSNTTVSTLTLIGENYAYYKNYPQALKYFNEALNMADSLKIPGSKKVALHKIASIYEELHQWDSAYYYFTKYISVRDTIDNKSIRDQLARKEAEYEFSIKEKELLHQKELSDVAAASANTELQRQLLLARTREQQLELKDKALEIGRKDREMQHLAYLKKMAELDVVKLDKQDKEKQLSLTKQNFTVQELKLGKRELERNLLIVGVALSFLSIFLVFRIYRNQRKAALRQKELNTVISGVNEELNLKNTELAATLDNLRTTQAQLVETEKQKENEVIRRRDISSGLTRIAWLSELAKEKASQGLHEDAASALQKIVSSSRETVDRLGEIIWAINPDRDNLQGFFAYLRTYIVKFFEDTPFKVTLDFPEKKPDLKFNPDLKRTLFLVVKEALHNVAKHSKASRVAVAFHCPDHRYSITITDDGKGFDMAATQLKGNGLKNMQKRMESVGGKIEIDSRPTKGTVVNLIGEVYS
jgi:signal transduction histidine kinase